MCVCVCVCVCVWCFVRDPTTTKDASTTEQATAKRKDWKEVRSIWLCVCVSS